MLLALFLLDLAAGLYLFLPLAGRRYAGAKFYRLMLIVSGALTLCACIAHVLAHSPLLRNNDLVLVALTVIIYATLRYPRRLIFRLPAVLLGVTYAVCAVIAWQITTGASPLWSVAGALSSIALLGSVNLAMTLGHWYLVVRGMSIDPLKRLTIATLVAAIVRVLVVVLALTVGAAWHEMATGQMIFFLMRAGWGLIGPLALFPMVWGTVRIRSTMAATGILYVDVVAVVIGEVLGGWLAAIAHVPV